MTMHTGKRSQGKAEGTVYPVHHFKRKKMKKRENPNKRDEGLKSRSMGAQ